MSRLGGKHVGFEPCMRTWLGMLGSRWPMDKRSSLWEMVRSLHWEEYCRTLKRRKPIFREGAHGVVFALRFKTQQHLVWKWLYNWSSDFGLVRITLDRKNKHILASVGKIFCYSASESACMATLARVPLALASSSPSHHYLRPLWRNSIPW